MLVELELVEVSRASHLRSSLLRALICRFKSAILFLISVWLALLILAEELLETLLLELELLELVDVEVEVEFEVLVLLLVALEVPTAILRMARFSTLIMLRDSRLALSRGIAMMVSNDRMGLSPKV